MWNASAYEKNVIDKYKYGAASNGANIAGRFLARNCDGREKVTHPRLRDAEGEITFSPYETLRVTVEKKNAGEEPALLDQCRN